jgi:hypothetical protein
MKPVLSIGSQSRPWFIVAALLPFLSTGCLVFEKQTIHAVYSPQDDTLEMIFVYEGLHHEGEYGQKKGLPPNPDVMQKRLKQSQADLAALVNTKDGFYLGHPEAKISFEKMQKNPPEDAHAKALMHAIQDHVSVSKGKLFFNQDKKLSYYHYVKIQKASQFVAKGNELISEAVLRNNQPPAANAPEWEKDLRERFVQAAKKGHPWVKLEPGRLSLTLPVNQEAIVQAKKSLLHLEQIDILRDDIDSISRGENIESHLFSLRMAVQNWKFTGDFIAENNWSLAHHKDSAKFSLGVGGSEPIPAIFPWGQVNPKTAQPGNLVPYAQTLGADVWDSDATVAGVLQAFRQKHLPAQK